MIDEQLEFLISQYADGSLPESERALVELRLQTDADARAMLEEYRSLDASLKGSLPLPAVNWDRLAAHLSNAVAAEREHAHTAGVWGRIGFGVRLAIAACVMLAAVGLVLWTVMKPGHEGNTTIVHNGGDPVVNPSKANANPDVAPVTPRPAPVVIVRGPAAQAAPAAPVVVVSVGPSSDVTPNWRAAEGVVTGPSRAIWIASSYDGAQDTQRLPY